MSAETQKRRPLLGNGSANTPVARQWLSSRHVIAAADKHATIEELLEAFFPMRFVPRLYNKALHSDPASRRRRRKGKSQM
jgi:hypothetical protein